MLADTLPHPALLPTLQLCFGSKAQHSTLSAALAATGAAAHLGMLVVISGASSALQLL
jgi:hypothetical protein